MSRLRKKDTRDKEGEESESGEELEEEADDVEEGITNPAVYVPDTGFVVMQEPNEADFASLIGRKFRKAGKHVRVAYKFDNEWQTGRWESVIARATRAETELAAIQVAIHTVKFQKSRYQLKLVLALYGMEGQWCLVEEEEPCDSE